VVVTYNSTTAKIYINGELDKTGTVGAVTSNSTHTFYIGVYGNGTTAEWEGKIASIRIHHKTLTASEITQTYNATKNRFI
jgi:hypothetical protein